jgi:hypothetical protein
MLVDENSWCLNLGKLCITLGDNQLENFDDMVACI